MGEVEGLREQLRELEGTPWYLGSDGMPSLLLLVFGFWLWPLKKVRVWALRFWIRRLL